MMKNEILGLLKFGSRKHMEDFRQNGTMYMNTVEFFRKLEGKGDIGDEDEGLESCHQSDRVNVKITTSDGQPIILTKDNGLTNQIETRYNAADSLNIFCMYAIKYCGKKPVVDERNFVFGDTYLCITNGSLFLERLRGAVAKAKINITRGLVEYVSRDGHNGRMGIFKKFTPYSYQNEYRFILSPGFSKPYSLVLGDLSDITTIGASKDITSILNSFSCRTSMGGRRLNHEIYLDMRQLELLN
jgi:hypothetical protein